MRWCWTGPYPPKGPCTVPPAGTFDNYLDLYDPLASEVQKGNLQAISCDASSNTLTASNVYMRGHRPRTNVTIAELMREAQPYLKLVVMLRDPVDRLYSAYYYIQPVEAGSADARRTSRCCPL
ncbi:hypothetical protein CYMTET_33825, partial [Cymbomonas tetramitiformis]